MSQKIFISYSSLDRELVDPFVRYLEQEGYEVWWDRNIIDAWGAEIEQQIEDCAAVISIVTEASQNSSFVVREMQMAQERRKLIAVILSGFKLNYPVSGLICLNQNFTVQTFADLRRSEFIDFLRRRMKEPGGVGADNPAEAPPSSRLFQIGRDPEILALAISLLFFHDKSVGVVESAAERFLEVLAGHLEAKIGEPESKKDRNEILMDALHGGVPRTERFQSIGAEIVEEKHPIYGTPVQCARFKNREDVVSLLHNIWINRSDLRYSINDWLIKEVKINRPEISDASISFALSIIIRQDFATALNSWIIPWLLYKDNYRLAKIADFALSIAVSDPSLSGAVPALFDYLINESEKLSFQDQKLYNVVLVRLITGFTGAKVPADSEKAIESLIERSARVIIEEDSEELFQFFVNEVTQASHISEFSLDIGVQKMPLVQMASKRIRFHRKRIDAPTEEKTLGIFVISSLFILKSVSAVRDPKNPNDFTLKDIADSQTLAKDVQTIFEFSASGRGGFSVEARKIAKDVINHWIKAAKGSYDDSENRQKLGSEDHLLTFLNRVFCDSDNERLTSQIAFQARRLYAFEDGQFRLALP